MWKFIQAILLFSRLVSSLPAGQEKAKRQYLSTYDYVIVGCGAAGLTVASRLSELEGTTVLCLEAGPLDENEPAITIPYYIGLQPGGFYDWQIQTIPQSQLDGKVRPVTMGKGVGGGTLINGLVWNRGHQANYASWVNMGNNGWSWDDLLPYFVRSETFTPKQYPDQQIPSASFGTATHGNSGPIRVSYPNYFWEQSNNWFQALESLGVPTVTDPNQGTAAGGYFLPSSLNPDTQTRSDARRTYYDGAISRPNLEVLPDSQVTRIIFNNTNGLHATGVEYSQGGNYGRKTINARREVILAAGAVHTPQILELSGIGQSSILREYGIQVLEDLPGVGNNLQDHAMVHLNYQYTDPSIVTVYDFQSNATFNAECANEYDHSRTGPWTAKSSQSVAFPSLQQITSDSESMLAAAPDDADSYLPSNYESTLRAGYQRQISSVIAELRSGTVPVFENLNNNAGGLDVSMMRPLSRGTCHITTTDPFTPPAVDPRWLVNPFDMNVLVAAVQFNQKLLDTPALSALRPSYVDVPRDATPAQLRTIIQRGVGTEYHYSGTAAMLPRNLGGVVDTNLIVYGTDNVRVVDTSVFPIVPGAHLQAVAYAVAERAADIIKGVKFGPAKY